VSDLIERLEGHIETLRGVASSVYSDDIREAVDALEQAQTRIKEIEEILKVERNLLDRVEELETALHKIKLLGGSPQITLLAIKALEQLSGE